MIEKQYNEVRYLQFSHYQQFPELTHGIFTRAGGISQPPYQGLNTSTPPKGAGGDSIQHVVHNRLLALLALNVSTLPCMTLWQLHGADVVTFEHKDEWRTDWAYPSYYEQSWTATSIRKGDALITQERASALALSFADCVPITFYDPIKQVMGIAHGGWRGTARGIVMATLAAMRAQFGSQPENIYAGIGPAIGPCCYEVSQTVQDLFSGRLSFDEMPTREEYRSLVRESAVFSHVQLSEKTSLRLDLQETNRNQLLIAGVAPERIEVIRICTSCHTKQFFSHRGENGQTGRFAVIMALQPL